jgi:hypothetical protein
MFFFGFLHFVLWFVHCDFLFSAVVLALVVCAVVACRAAYADTVALAHLVLVLAAAVHEHLEQAQTVMQVVKLGVDARDDGLGELGERFFEVFDEAHCHFDHDFHDHVGWCVLTALCLAPISNAFLVLVDLRALNLHCANDHSAMVADVCHQRQNGQRVLKTKGAAGLGFGFRIQLFKLALNGKKMVEKQFGAACNNCQGRCFHFLYRQQMNLRTMKRWNGTRRLLLSLRKTMNSKKQFNFSDFHTFFGMTF